MLFCGASAADAISAISTSTRTTATLVAPASEDGLATGFVVPSIAVSNFPVISFATEARVRFVVGASAAAASSARPVRSAYQSPVLLVPSPIAAAAGANLLAVSYLDNSIFTITGSASWTYHAAEQLVVSSFPSAGPISGGFELLAVLQGFPVLSAAADVNFTFNGLTVVSGSTLIYSSALVSKVLVVVPAADIGAVAQPQQARVQHSSPDGIYAWFSFTIPGLSLANGRPGCATVPLTDVENVFNKDSVQARPSSVPATVERVDCLKGPKMAYVTATALQPTATTSASIVAGSVVSPQDCAAQTCTQLQRPIPAIPAGVGTSTVTNVVTGVKAAVAITATAVTPLLSSPVATAAVVAGSVAGGTVTQVAVAGFPVVASTSDVLFKVGSVVNRVVSSAIDSTVLVVTTPSGSAGPHAAAVSSVSSGSDLANPATGTLTFTCTLREPAVRQAYPLHGLDVGGCPMHVTLTGFPAVASGLSQCAYVWASDPPSASSSSQSADSSSLPSYMCTASGAIRLADPTLAPVASAGAISFVRPRQASIGGTVSIVVSNCSRTTSATAESPGTASDARSLAKVADEGLVQPGAPPPTKAAPVEPPDGERVGISVTATLPLLPSPLSFAKAAQARLPITFFPEPGGYPMYVASTGSPAVASNLAIGSDDARVVPSSVVGQRPQAIVAVRTPAFGAIGGTVVGTAYAGAPALPLPRTDAAAPALVPGKIRAASGASECDTAAPGFAGLARARSERGDQAVGVGTVQPAATASLSPYGGLFGLLGIAGSSSFAACSTHGWSSSWGRCA